MAFVRLFSAASFRPGTCFRLPVRLGILSRSRAPSRPAPLPSSGAETVFRVEFALVIFVSALLLFQVQLVMAKVILPWFGGAAAVWGTCMLFFQVLLLAGYLYAHWSVSHLSPRAQALVHIAVLAAAASTLPILPGEVWKPADPGHPAGRILLLLSATVGLPFLALSATSPLLQAWYTRRRDSAPPWHLFALSNLGSMLGLLTYPLLVEPLLAVRVQGWVWSGGFLVFAAFCARIAWDSRRDGIASGMAGQRGRAPFPGWQAAVLWVLLAATASMLFLAVTNVLTQDVAPVPFLWTLPLTIYLLSFILCFSGDGRAYRPALFRLLLLPTLAALAWLVTSGPQKLNLAVTLAAAGTFVCCMVCHGELVRLKPHPTHLTAYYLLISAGGALGGLFVGALAPVVFSDYVELPLGIILCALVFGAVLLREGVRPDRARRRGRAVTAALPLLAALLLAGWTALRMYRADTGARLTTRDFYGVLRITDWDADNPAVALRELHHGNVPHGTQFMAPWRRREPTTYYGPGTGIGRLLLGHRAGQPRTVGIIGLGAGTLAAYARPGDTWRIYEINPQVIDLAGREFSYLQDAGAAITVVAGDGRLAMERDPTRGFDICVVDAFSGDAIPVHLLTREAFQLYFSRLKPDGVLAVHVTNGYLNLAPVVGRLADVLGKRAVLVSTDPEEARGVYGADWMLVGAGPELLADPVVGSRGSLQNGRGGPLWTDDYSNLFRILR